MLFTVALILGRRTCIVNTISMIRVKLREAMDSYRQRTGKKLTYELLAQQTGIALTTLQSLAARPGYNTRLSTIEKICVALKCCPSDLLEMSDDADQ
jgi:DNA-binding Xre family transcriptional regulator